LKIILLYEQRSGIEITQKFGSTSFRILCSGMETIFKERYRIDRRGQKKSNKIDKIFKGSKLRKQIKEASFDNYGNEKIVGRFDGGV
jgi:hypothetical protein